MAIVLHTGPTKGSCDDLVAKADAWMGGGNKLGGWDGKGEGAVPNIFKDGFSARMRATYATSLLIHSTSS